MLAAVVVGALVAAASVVAAATGVAPPAGYGIPDRAVNHDVTRAVPDPGSRHALTERLVQGRRRTLPASVELAARWATSTPVEVPRAAAMLADAGPTVGPSNRAGRVTGAEIGRGAPDAALDDGMGAGSASAGRTGGSGSAVVARVDPLTLHAGSRLARYDRDTEPIHTSNLPLERPD